MTENRMIYVTKVFFKYLLIFTLGITISGYKIAEAKNSIDEKSVNEIISKAKPVIEEITGRKFKSDVEYKIVSRNDFQNIYIENSLSIEPREWEKEMGEDILKR